jgi:hypothetical protein
VKHLAQEFADATAHASLVEVVEEHDDWLHLPEIKAWARKQGKNLKGQLGAFAKGLAGEGGTAAESSAAVASGLDMSRDQLYKMAQEAAKKGGFAHGWECTAKELKRWARLHGKDLDPPLGAYARLIALERPHENDPALADALHIARALAVPSKQLMAAALAAATGAGFIQAKRASRSGSRRAPDQTSADGGRAALAMWLLWGWVTWHRWAELAMMWQAKRARDWLSVTDAIEWNVASAAVDSSTRNGSGASSVRVPSNKSPHKGASEAVLFASKDSSLYRVDSESTIAASQRMAEALSSPLQRSAKSAKSQRRSESVNIFEEATQSIDMHRLLDEKDQKIAELELKLAEAHALLVVGIKEDADDHSIANHESVQEGWRRFAFSRIVRARGETC